MRRIIGIGVGVVAAGIAAELVAGTRRLRVSSYHVAVPGLPDTWRGVRIAHLSDFHAGARGTPLALLMRAKAAALESTPDVIALTGDYYDNGITVPVGSLWNEWPDGTAVVGVLGNHDFRGPPKAPDHVVQELRDAGIYVLRNSALCLPLRGSPAWVVGVDDPFTWQADERAAFSQIPDGDEALLYLLHSPSIDGAVPLGRARIALSGHTHAGQVRLLASGRIPFVRALRRMRGTPKRRDPVVYRGIHWLRGMLVFVSDGIGVSRLPLRFRTRPHVIILELEPVQANGQACDDPRRYVRSTREHRGVIRTAFGWGREPSSSEA